MSNYHNDAEMRVAMSEQHEAARREMRRLLLAVENEELRDAYYRVLTLAEHEARRVVLEQLDEKGSAMNIVDLAWASFGAAFDRWWESLPADDPLHDADYYPDQLDAFFAAHPDGWPVIGKE